MHIVFSTDCRPYQEWQSKTLVHSALQVGQLEHSHITQIVRRAAGAGCLYRRCLCSGCEGEHANAENILRTAFGNFHVHIAEKYSPFKARTHAHTHAHTHARTHPPGPTSPRSRSSSRTATSTHPTTAPSPSGARHCPQAPCVRHELAIAGTGCTTRSDPSTRTWWLSSTPTRSSSHASPLTTARSTQSPPRRRWSPARLGSVPRPRLAQEDAGAQQPAAERNVRPRGGGPPRGADVWAG
jgi:hypothetical protein